MKIAISGATGQLGKLVIEALLKKISSQHIIALIRDPSKAAHLKQQGIETRHFDYDQPDSLAPALAGIDKLLLISANEIGRRLPQHQAVITAAQAAHIPYIAYTSLYNADHSPLGLAEEHRKTEALIRRSGMAYTLLRNNWYSENYLAQAEQAVAQGVLYGSAQQGLISSAARADYAQAAANVLLSHGHEQKTYELAGSRSYRLADLAAYIADTAQTPVIYQDLAPEDYRQALLDAGLATELVAVIVDADVQAAKGALYSEQTDLEHLLGHASTPIQTQLHQLLQPILSK